MHYVDTSHHHGGDFQYHGGNVMNRVGEYIDFIEHEDVTECISMCLNEGDDKHPVSFHLGWALFLLFSLYCLFVGIVLWPYVIDEFYCFNGTSMRKNEQFICGPNVSTTVTIERDSTDVNIYRIDQHSLPKMVPFSVVINSSEQMTKTFSISSFNCLKGSSIDYNCVCDSSSSWFLVDFENRMKVNKESFSWIVKGESPFKGVYSVSQPGEYSVVAEDVYDAGITIYRVINVSYMLYDVSKINPLSSCNSKTCSFRNVSPNDVFIVQNREDKTVNVTAHYRGEVNVLNTVFIFGTAFCLLVATIVCFVWFFIERRRRKEAKKRMSRKPGKWTSNFDPHNDCSDENAHLIDGAEDKEMNHVSCGKYSDNEED